MQQLPLAGFVLCPGFMALLPRLLCVPCESEGAVVGRSQSHGDSTTAFWPEGKRQRRDRRFGGSDFVLETVVP